MGNDVAERAADNRGKRGSCAWIEAPEQVLGPIETFPEGAWPETTQEVESLDPEN